MAGMQQGRGSAIPAGTACQVCHTLSSFVCAQHKAQQQETIAFPSASPTLGKSPRQPAEEISGVSCARTEPLLHHDMLPGV